jgi:two-component system chemotaxis response regulator CheB
MPPRSIIVIGASAGGVESLTKVIHDLSADIPAAIFVTIHFPPTGTSALARILTRAGKLRATHAIDGQRMNEGHVYIAPPDHHLLLFPDRMRLYRGPRENGNRPAVDPMFRSAALAFGSRVIGVILSGSLDDGTSGLLAIKRRGGIAVVQDPDDAPFPSMPQSAIDHIAVDHVVKLDRMGTLLNKLAHRTLASEETMATDDAEEEVEFAEADIARISDADNHPGVLAPFGCPDCGGTLWELREGNLVRFRCRVGHAWTSEALLATQAETLDAALWTALRALEESAALSQQLADRALSRGNQKVAERLVDNARLASHRAEMIRNVLIEDRSPDIDVAEETAEAHPAPLHGVLDEGVPGSD